MILGCRSSVHLVTLQIGADWRAIDAQPRTGANAYADHIERHVQRMKSMEEMVANEVNELRTALHATVNELHTFDNALESVNRPVPRPMIPYMEYIYGGETSESEDDSDSSAPTHPDELDIPWNGESEGMEDHRLQLEDEALEREAQHARPHGEDSPMDSTDDSSDSPTSSSSSSRQAAVAPGSDENMYTDDEDLYM